MNLEKLLAYTTHHSESITQWLCLITIILVGLVIARTLFAKREAGPYGTTALAGASPELEGTLAKIVDSVSKLEGLNLKGGGAASGSEGSSANADVESLRAELKARDAELEALRGAGAAAGGAPVPAGSGDLATRVKDLEAKLAEYEILEDDIADLSLFKEENARLKEEVERLKLAGAPPAATTEASAGAPPAATTEASAGAPPAAASAAEPRPEFDPLNDVENALEDLALAQAALSAPPEVSGSAAVSAAAAEAAAAANALMDEPTPPAPRPEIAPAPVSEAEASDDLFAEFSSEPETSPEGFQFDNLDPDKILAELDTLGTPVAGEVGNVLEEDIDIERMATEAKSSGKA